MQLFICMTMGLLYTKQQESKWLSGVVSTAMGTRGEGAGGTQSHSRLLGAENRSERQ